MARRTGLPSMLDLAEKLCLFIVRYQGVIRNIYPDATELHLALDAALIACETLAIAISEVLPVGD